MYQDLSDNLARIPEYPAKPLPCPLTLTEQRLILDFGERAAMLSSERRSELAGSLAFLTGNSDEEPQLALLSYANWLARGR